MLSSRLPVTHRPLVVAHDGIAPILMADATLAKSMEVAIAMNFIMSKGVEEMWVVDVKVEEVLWIVRLRAFVVSDC